MTSSKKPSDYIRYIDGIPQGLDKIYDLAICNDASRLVNAGIVSGFALGMGTLVTALSIGYYSERTKQVLDYFSPPFLLALFAGPFYASLISALTISGFSKPIKKEKLRKLEKSHPDFLTNYPQLVDYFANDSKAIEELPTNLADAVRIDVMPYFVSHFDAERLERIIYGLDCTFAMDVGLFSSDRRENNRFIGYSFLAELAVEAKIFPDDIAPLFIPKGRSSYERWVGRNKLLCGYWNKNPHLAKRLEELLNQPI